MYGKNIFKKSTTIINYSSRKFDCNLFEASFTELNNVNKYVLSSKKEIKIEIENFQFQYGQHPGRKH